MGDVLLKFVAAWQESFSPPPPSRGKDGKDWQVSDAWSVYLKEWLSRRYSVMFDRGLLDAAVWLNKEDSVRAPMDLAIEWEWKNELLKDEFPDGDLIKVLWAPAREGLAIIQTRADGSGMRGPDYANETIARLKQVYQALGNGRPVGIIDVRRTFNSRERCRFEPSFYDLVADTVEAFRPFEFHE